MPVCILQLVLLFLLVGSAAPAPGPGRGRGGGLWQAESVVRQGTGVPGQDLKSRFDIVKDIDTHCPKIVEHLAITSPDNFPEIFVFHNQMVHDGKPCDAQNPIKTQSNPKMVVLPSALANRKPDKQFRFRVMDLLAAQPLKPFNQFLLARNARYSVGHEARDRICSLETIFPRDTVFFFVEPNESLEVPGMNSSVEQGSQYMIVWEPDHDVAQCLYISKTIPVPLSPSPSPATSDEDSDALINQPRPEFPTSAPRPDSSGSTDSSLSGEESSGAVDVAATSLSPGAIAGIAVGSTIMAISIAAAAFVSYRIYHGRTVPMIPELLLPGPPSR